MVMVVMMMSLPLLLLTLSVEKLAISSNQTAKQIGETLDGRSVSVCIFLCVCVCVVGNRVPDQAASTLAFSC